MDTTTDDFNFNGNFGFAFNNPIFSDRVLSIEIIPDPVEPQQPNHTPLVIKHQNGDGTSMHGEVCAIKCSLPDAEDSIASKKQDRDVDSMIRESFSGEEATCSMDFSTVNQVKTIHISSAILAGKSPFFHKLFSYGMRESARVAKLQIHASEEAALMELLNFMYKNSLSTTTLSSLLDILTVADKYDVVSCMQYCSQQLNKLPMNSDLAFSYMDLPSSVLQALALQQLTDSAKQFIDAQFRDITKFEKQVLNLSLDGIEAILSSDDIQVFSEDVIYDLVLKWAEVHYPQLEERRVVLETRLRHVIRFPYMTSLKLKEVTTCTYFSPEVASEIVLDALNFKNETPERQAQLALGRSIGNPDQRFVKRAYSWPVRTVVMELPRHHCVVYLDITRKECLRLLAAGRYYSEDFYLGKHGFYLVAYCIMGPKIESHRFGLYLGMRGNGSESFKLDYEFAAWSKIEEKYKTEHKETGVSLRGGQLAGHWNLFNTSWKAFIAEESPYFINEEAALMELLNFMYKNSLSTTTLSSLLDILIAADKYDVVSCMQYCSQQLSKLPMNSDLAFSYMDLPSSVLQAVALQQLTDSAKQFIAFQFRDVTKVEKQVLNLSLAGIEAILSSDDIQVCSEDVVYDLVLKWAEVHYPQMVERRLVLETRLRHIIRFPYMTSLKLKEVTTGTYFSPEVASEIVLDALFFKTETPEGRAQLALGRSIGNSDQRFVKRAYMCWPVRAVVIELPRYHCVVYLDLKREECVHLFPAGRYYSDDFYLGKYGFYLVAYCIMDSKKESQHFGLYLGRRGNKYFKYYMLDYEFAAWSKIEEKYKTEHKESCVSLGEGKIVGEWNLFNTSWNAFIAAESPYFINGKLHLRAMVYRGDGTSMHGEVCAIKCSLPDAEDSIASKKQDRDVDSMIRESFSGEEATCSRDFSTVNQVKTIHINSAILAGKSPFFHKLFSYGMRESARVAKLQIHASEEAALMELLNFMYKNSLSTTTLSSLLDILTVADKYDVVSCMQYCSQQLSKLPMNSDLAFSYMDLPSSVLQAVALQQLTDSAKQFIDAQFRDITKFEKQVLNLSLDGIEAILSSDDIQVFSEDVIYDLVLKWAEVHYPQLEERRVVLETRLRHVIRFPYMTSLKLKEVTTGTYFSPEVASEIVLDALNFKNETPERQAQLALGRSIGNPDQRFVKRAYSWPVREVVMELPRHHCVVYLDLRPKECLRLLAAGRHYSEDFYLGKHGFYLVAYCIMRPKIESQRFGLYLGMRGNGSESFKLDYEFAAWSKIEEKYKTEHKETGVSLRGQLAGHWNLFNTSWKAFIAEESPYFINGKLQLRAVVYSQL